MNYSSALFEGDTTQPMPQAQHAKVRARCASAACSPGQPPAGDRLRLGRAGRVRRHRVRRPRDRRHAVGPSSWPSRRSAWPREGPGATAPTCACRTTATSPTEPFDAIASIEMFEAVGREYWAQLLRHAAQPAQARRPRLHPDHHHPRRPVRTLRALAPTSSSSTSSPAACCPARGLPRRGAARPAWRWSTNWPSARLRRDPAPLARGLPGARRAGAALGFDTRFMRIWEFYLAYCEAAFATGNTNVMQFTLRRRPDAAPCTPAGCCGHRALAPAAGPGQRRAAGRGGGGAAPGAPAGLRVGCASWACCVYEAGCGRPTHGRERLGRRAAGAGDRPTRARWQGQAIAERSLAEMRRQGPIDAGPGGALAGHDAQLFPDVRQGDRLTAVNRPGVGWPFSPTASRAANVDEPAFARRFFGIWLARRPPSRPCAARCWAFGKHREHADGQPRRLARWLGAGPAPMAGWACRWPSSRCRCTWCCPTTTPANSACRWPRWARCCWARACSTRWPTRSSALGRPRLGWPTRRAVCWWPPCWRGLLLAVGLSRAVLPAGRQRRRPAGLVRRPAGADLPQLQRAQRAAPGLGRAPGRRRDQRAGIVAWREGLALVGVLVASVLPSLAGLSVTSRGVRVTLVLGRGLAGAIAPAARGGAAGRQRPTACFSRCRPRPSCACWPSTWSTAWPLRCRPRWCCSSSATGCRRRPSSRCSWPATSPPGP
jgi:hypothetical protein